MTVLDNAKDNNNTIDADININLPTILYQKFLFC